MTTDKDILEQRNLPMELARVNTQLKEVTEEYNKLKEKGITHKFATSTTMVDQGDIPFVNQGKNYLLGYVSTANAKKRNYHETIKIVRWFYENDPIAGTVVNRMADMSITILRNRRKTKLNKEDVEDNVLAFYDALAEQLRPYLKIAALEFLLHGMVILDYTTVRLRGDKISEKLGRTRYTTLEKIWARNPENIVLKQRSVGMDVQVFFKVPASEVTFIQNKGTRSDGTEDKETYKYLLETFPEFVAQVQKGKTLFELADVDPILRKQNSYDEYPIPFLQNALKPLQHKEYLKAMDRSIARRMIQAIRHVKVGNDLFPADQDDIDSIQTLLSTVSNSSNDEFIYNLFTNHTVEIGWAVPPFEALINEAKYSEPNADIFLALGFPRILTVGETAKSNAADNKVASLGPKATLDDLRDILIIWLKKLYRKLADINGFTRIPDPYFSPISTTDITALIQFAKDIFNTGALSKDALAQLYGTDYQTEAGQIEAEVSMGVLSPTERATEQAQNFQVAQTEKAQQFQSEQADKQAAQQKQQQKSNTKKE